MRSAGYISDQRCPVSPEHGNAFRIGTGYFCPHSDHTKPGGQTTAFWYIDEWERIKSNNGKTDKPPTNRTKNKPLPNRRPRKAKRS